jgi:hypothetical protein
LFAICVSALLDELSVLQQFYAGVILWRLLSFDWVGGDELLSGLSARVLSGAE